MVPWAVQEAEESRPVGSVATGPSHQPAAAVESWMLQEAEETAVVDSEEVESPTFSHS